jgi:hypothetical protein
MEAQVGCFDPDCLGGKEARATGTLQATTCDDPGCGVQGFVCSDYDCRFLQEYVSGIPWDAVEQSGLC